MISFIKIGSWIIPFPRTYVQPLPQPEFDPGLMPTFPIARGLAPDTHKIPHGGLYYKRVLRNTE